MRLQSMLRSGVALSGILVAVSGFSQTPQARVEKRGLTVDDMWAMQRLSEPTVSPDGKRVAFTVATTDMGENRSRTDIWLVDVGGGSPVQLTSHAENDGSPQFSPDGQYLYFLSARSGQSQVYRISLTGGEPQPITALPVDVHGFRIFPDGRRLLLSLDVYPDANTLQQTLERDQARDKSKVKAKIYDELMFRHWDAWEDGKRLHLFVWSPDTPHKPIDLMRGSSMDAPTRPFGGMEEVTISPDGTRLVFTGKDMGAEAAWSTNDDLWRVTTDGKGKLENLTRDNPATDTCPVFSPDGRTLAYLAMARPQYESDRKRVVLLDVATSKKRVLTETWDRSPQCPRWAEQGRTLLASADHIGKHALFAISAATGQVRTVFERGANNSPVVAGNQIVFLHDTLIAPAELYRAELDGSGARPLTAFNAARKAAIDWGAYEQFSFAGAKGEQVFGYLVKPAGGIKPGQKVPVAVLIHGGPQGSFGDHFHYRWNPELYAGHGYAAIFIDFHGSTGYGQAFTDSIRGDWGGAPYEDLMKGLDAALAKYPFLDRNRVAALGASYGGYMINWINGNTDRFKALVCHDGNLDERMAYFDTEELWFPEWEHRGLPWQSDSYTKQNPIDRVQHWKTPTLVIHGGRDYRVVDTQGMSTFTALRRRGIPSRLVYFPDENHWVVKPQNSKLWHSEVFRWLDRFTLGR